MFLDSIQCEMSTFRCVASARASRSRRLAATTQKHFCWSLVIMYSRALSLSIGTFVWSGLPHMHRDTMVCRVCLSSNSFFSLMLGVCLSTQFNPYYAFSTCCAAFCVCLCVAGILWRISSSVQSARVLKTLFFFFLSDLCSACAEVKPAVSIWKSCFFLVTTYLILQNSTCLSGRASFQNIMLGH